MPPIQKTYWELEGELQKDLKHCIFPGINRVLKVFFGPDGKGELFTLHGYMVGTRQPIAKPTILLIGKDDKTRKAAMKAVRDSTVLTEYPEWQFDDSREFPDVKSVCTKPHISENLAELELWSSSGPIIWRDAENSHSQAADVYLDLRMYIRQPSNMPSKGLTIYIDHGSYLRVATANIVELGDRIFLQTVHHSFQPIANTKTPTETDVRQSDVPIPPSKQELTLVGRLLVWSVTRDWALIETMNEDMLFHMSRTLREETGARCTFQEAGRPSATIDPVYTWTASRARTKVTLLETTMYLKLPNSNSFEEVYKAYLESGSWSIGDSGAVVMRPSTESTIGHVLGGDRAVGVALILAADEVVEDFKGLDFSSHLHIGVCNLQLSGIHESISASQSTETRDATEVSLDEPPPQHQTAKQESPRKELLPTADLVVETPQSSSKPDSDEFKSPRNLELAKHRAPYFKSSGGLFDPYEDEEAGDNTYNRQLVRASERGEENVMKSLIEGGADVNAQDPLYGSALVAASSEGHEKVVKLLLDHGADANVQDNYRMRSALAAASREGHENIVRLLLDYGADVNAQGWLRGSALSEASREGHEKLVKLLLDRGAIVSVQERLYESPLVAASSKGHENVARVLLDHGGGFDAKDEGYKIAILEALRKGHTKVARLLLEHGANFDAKDKSYKTALLEALHEGHEEIVRLLLAYGTDFNAEDKRYKDALLEASSKGYEEMVRLLLDHGANGDVKDNIYETALLVASRKGYERIVKLLLDKCPDINGKETALLGASEEGHEKVVSLLLASDVRVDIRDGMGRTPLLRAAQAKQEEMVKFLLTTTDVDPDAEDNLGFTPLFWASFNGQKDMIRCLRDHMKIETEVQNKLTTMRLSLRGKYMLNARFTNDQNLEQDTHIDLDEILGNNDGVFEWRRRYFFSSGSQLSLSVEGEQVLLKALLKKENGEYTVCQVDLAEHLYVSNGHFRWFDQTEPENLP